MQSPKPEVWLSETLNSKSMYTPRFPQRPGTLEETVVDVRRLGLDLLLSV